MFDTRHHQVEENPLNYLTRLLSEKLIFGEDLFKHYLLIVQTLPVNCSNITC